MSIEESIKKLREDLIQPHGPTISTNQNYPFAILRYDPGQEFQARELVGNVVDELRLKGWNIRTIDLFALFMKHLHQEEEGELLNYLIDEEKNQFNDGNKDFRLPLAVLKNSLPPLLNNRDGYPKAVLKEIQGIAQGADPKKSVLFLSRIGALYPFYRTSALLRFLDEGVRIPTVVLYPGKQVDNHYLSFMGTVTPDRDYRPRIY